MSYHDDDLDETGPYFFEETPRQSPLNPYGAVPTQAKLQEEISKRNPSIRRFVNNSSNYQEDLGETGSSIYEEIVQTSDNMNEFHPRQRPVNPYRTAVTQDEIQEEIPKQRPPTRRFVNNSSKYHEDLVGTGSIFYDEILQTTDNMNGFHPRQKPVNPYKAVPTQAKLQDETPKQSTPTRRLVNQKELEFKSRIDTRKPLLSNIRAAISKVGNHFEIDTGKLAVVLKKYEENNNFDRHGYDVSFRYENEMIFFLLQAAVCSLARSVILVSPISDLGTVAPSSYQLALNFMINLQCRRTCEAPEKSKQDTTGTFSHNKDITKTLSKLFCTRFSPFSAFFANFLQFFTVSLFRMSSDIENLAKQTENLSIEPIYNTNWCDMPAEIKVECIGKMELIERLSLRSTAKDERSLVDSQTIKFRKGEFRGNAYCFDASLYSENGYELSKNLTDSSNEAFEFVRYIWKVGVFENLKISFYGTAYTRKMKKYTGEIKAKNVELHYEYNTTQQQQMTKKQK
ncbi:hypothetical protein B9Z55_012786 [Caenorhabditis nigoni]|uniref:F-box domain-containing protein n=1 Tax=Caenorhabditis nigoni TaxID=1611254 RepID=A0A2G5TYZ1_9PELO|nr:hypothetical protein B9Z55_012786 [Caenorhabditis nigoni]